MKYLVILFLILSLTGCKDKGNTDNKNTDGNVESKIALTLKDVTIKENENYTVNDFVESCLADGKNECVLEIKDNSKLNEEGVYDVEIIATYNGKSISKIAKLTIIKSEEDKKDTENDSNKNHTNNDKVVDQTTSTKNTNSNKNNTTSNKNTSTNKNNQTSTTNNKNTNTVTNKVTKVDTKKEVSEDKTMQKYGVTKIVTTTKTYDVYSDGTISTPNISTTTKYDYSTFNAKTNDMLDEANTEMVKNSALIESVLEYTNVYRSEVNVSPLSLDNNLTKAAMIRALEMAYANKFSHTRPNGSSCFTIFEELSIPRMGAGENIASGYGSSKSVSEGWKDSPGHYANMINSNFNKLGVGVFRYNNVYYWVQLFSN